MRVKLTEKDRIEAELGITPAHAGKTQNAHLWDEQYRDHPRACG